MKAGIDEKFQSEVESRLAQAELALKRHAAETLFLRNLNFFKANDAFVYEVFRDYRVVGKGLEVDSSGHANVVQNGDFLYAENPELSARKQVDSFVKSPVRCSYYFPSNQDKTIRDHFLHFEHLCQITECIEAKEATPGFNQPFPSDLSSFVMFGVGLGYHIWDIVDRYEVDQLIVYEQDSDMLYFSLFCIDWSLVYEKVKGVFFLVGDRANKFIETLQVQFSNVGFWHFSNTYFYCHYNDKKSLTGVEQKIALYHSLFLGWGFIDDELISIQHTFANLKNNRAMLNLKGNGFSDAIREVPFLVVGNGPSLDNDIETLLALAPNCMIICCGCSTLKSLYRYGIQPDFLTVIERGRGVVEWIEEVGDKAYLSGIRILTINNTHPDVIQYFNQCGIAIKPNDCGGEILKRHLVEAANSELPLCCPNGVNAAISFLVEFGFKTAFMFGMDLGFRDKTHHHSKKSAYYSESGNHEYDKFDRSDDELVERIANFGGKVQTNHSFDISRVNLERRLSCGTALSCFNCSDGVLIGGTKPLRPEDVSVTQLLKNKSVLCDEVMNVAFPTVTRNDINWCDVEEELRADFNEYLNDINAVGEHLKSALLEEISSVSEIYPIFERQKEMLDQLRVGLSPDHAMYILFSGSVMHTQMIIARGLGLLGDDVVRMQFWTEAKSIFIQFIDAGVIKIKTKWEDVDGLVMWSDRKVI